MGAATPFTDECNNIFHFFRVLFPFMTLYLFLLPVLQLTHNVNMLKLTTVASVGTLSSLFVDWPSEFQVAGHSRSLFLLLKGSEHLLRLGLT